MHPLSPPPPAQPILPQTAPGLRWKLRLARWVLWWERLWPALVPPLSLAGAFVALALFDVLVLLPGWLHLLFLAAWATAIAALAWRGLSRLRPPSPSEAARRLERDSGLAHRPLAALDDRLAAGDGDPLADALWRRHLARMAEAARTLNLRPPSPGMAARDPWTLRFIVPLALAVALPGSWADMPRRLARAVTPAVSLPGPQAAALDVWVTPPAHTGLAPLTLSPDHIPTEPLSVPAGSTVLAVLSGGWGDASLTLGGTSWRFQRLGDGSQRLEARINGGDRLEVHQGWRRLAAWPIRVGRDALPSIAFSEPPAEGERGRLRLAVAASDDYGVTKARIVIRRLGAPDTEPPLTLDLSLPAGRPKSYEGASWHDLTAHPWAGLPVSLHPEAEDAIGQVGTGEAVGITLPERIFLHPVARQLVELRRQLTEDPSRASETAAHLDRIGGSPEALNHDLRVILALRLARDVLAGGEFDLAEVQGLLWNAALRLEDGEMASAETALDRAREALERALADNAPADELRRLLEEYRDALARYLNALAQQMIETGRLSEILPGQQAISDEDLAQMLDTMRDLAETGARDALSRMLEDMTQLLSELRSGTPPADGTAQALDDLRDISRRQQEMLDQSFERTQPGRDRPRPQRETGDSQGAAGRQGELRDRLSEVMREMGDAPDALGQARDAMDDAARALGEGAWDEAAEFQGEAMRLLREGARQALERMAGPAGTLGRMPRDPLGRPLQGRPGLGDDRTTRIPTQAETRRAREILDELRRRAGEGARPPAELDYLRRLLKQF